LTVFLSAGFEVHTAVSMKMAVFWVVGSTRLHGTTTQKIAIFIFLSYEPEKDCFLFPTPIGSG
jgi:hypothetical protein